MILGVKPITASAGSYVFGSTETGLPGGTRTPDLLLRRQLLYPVELRAVWDVAVDLEIIQALQDGASLLYRLVAAMITRYRHHRSKPRGKRSPKQSVNGSPGC